MYIQGGPVEILHNWNLIGRSMTAPITCAIPQQYSSTTFLSLRFHSRKEKYRGCYKNVISFLFNFSSLKLRESKVRKMGNVSNLLARKRTTNDSASNNSLHRTESFLRS